MAHALLILTLIASDVHQSSETTAAQFATQCYGQGHGRDVARKLPLPPDVIVDLGTHIDRQLCVQYLAGVIEMNTAVTATFGKGMFCLPKKAPVWAHETLDKVLTWITAAPERTSYGRLLAVTMALKEMFPCPTKASP